MMPTQIPASYQKLDPRTVARLLAIRDRAAARAARDPREGRTRQMPAVPMADLIAGARS